jgi:hypothetical protein
MRIDSSGKVGIGTTTPNNELEVVTGSNPSIALTSTSASLYSYFGLTSGTVGAQLYTFGQSYSAVYPAGCTALSNNTWGLIFNANNASGIITYQTNGTERMRLDSSGNLLVNTTSASAGGKVNINAQCYSANGLAIKDTQEIYTGTTYFAVFVNSAGTLAGGIQHNASTTVNYVTSSDSRLKTLIKVATETSVIDNLVINDFTWKDGGKVDRGVFAQDAQKIIPNAISEGTDELTEDGNLKNPWGVDYSKFVPDLIVHAQQLKKQVQELSALVTAQSATITSLTERITALEGK